MRLSGCTAGTRVGLVLNASAGLSGKNGSLHLLLGSAPRQLRCASSTAAPGSAGKAAFECPALPEVPEGAGRFILTELAVDGAAPVRPAVEASVEVSRPVGLRSVARDPDHCLRLAADRGGEPAAAPEWGCEPGALLVLSGTNLATTAGAVHESLSIVLVPTARGCAAAPPGSCQVEHAQPSRLTCILDHPEVPDSCGRGFPEVAVEVRTPQGVLTVPAAAGGSFAVLLPPSVRQLTFEQGCMGGNGSLALRGCRNGTVLTVHGARLAVTRQATSVVVRSSSGHGGRARCVLIEAEPDALRCTLVRVARGFGADDAAALRAAITVVTFAGRSRTSAEVELLPPAVLTRVAPALPEACTGSNASLLHAGACANNSVIVVSGEGIFGSAGFTSNTTECRCEPVSDDASEPRSEHEDHSMGRRTLRCRLMCRTAGQTAEIRLTGPGAGTQSGFTIAFKPPPEVQGLAYELAPDGSGGCSVTEDGAALSNCSDQTRIVVSGADLEPAHPAALLLLPVVSQGGGGWGVRPAPVVSSAVASGAARSCVVEVDASTSSRLRCRLDYAGLPLAGTDAYAVVAGGTGGLSLSPLLPPPPAAGGGGDSLGGWAEHTAAGGLAGHLAEVPPHRIGGAAAPVLRLLPRPNVTRLSGCHRTGELGRCVIRSGERVTLHGVGFAPGQTADLEQSREGKEPVYLPAGTAELNVTGPSEAVCRFRHKAGDVHGVVHLTVSGRGGASHPIDILLLPPPRVDSLSGCSGGSPGDGPVCRQGQRLTVHGVGFLPNCTVRITSTESGGEPAPLQVEHVAPGQVEVTLQHVDSAGGHSVQLSTEGGSATLAGAVLYLRPLPVVERLVTSVGCLPAGEGALSRGGGAGPSVTVQRRRQQQQRRQQRAERGDADTVRGLCMRGGELEIRGRNLGGATAEFHPVSNASGDGEESTGTPPTCQAMPQASSATVLHCRLRHTDAAGLWQATVHTDGGSATNESAVVRPLPAPIISAVYFGKKRHCVSGNGSTELMGCVSGTLVTISGAHFMPSPRVRFRAGKAGGINGPPDCIVMNEWDDRVVCLLDHTSAAGGFEIAVSTVFGESDHEAVISVLPGNLYLLLKNTALVLAVSTAVGWISALVWAGSCWALAYNCWIQRSTAGVAPDMIWYLAFGLAGWMLYCCYFYARPEHGIPSTFQDAFNGVATYAGVVVLIVLRRTWPSQKQVTTFAKVFVALLYAYILKYPAGAVLGFHGFSLHLFMPRLARVHLCCAVVKYLPQIFFNFQRKSTEGYSMGSVWLDLMGAVALLLQMFFDGVMRHKWSLMITLNLPKFLLCVQCVGFNLVFLTQHYILYGPAPASNLVPITPMVDDLPPQQLPPAFALSLKRRASPGHGPRLSPQPLPAPPELNLHTTASPRPHSKGLGAGRLGGCAGVRSPAYDDE